MATILHIEMAQRRTGAANGMVNETDTTPQIKRVWIAEGCIVCNLCEDTCPEVFDVGEDTCTIRPRAQTYYMSHARQIIQSAEECPVDVIRVAGVNEPDTE
jgi:ferredoxin